jgi:Bacterial TSP3 repeat
MNSRRCVEALFAGLLVVGVLLTPTPAGALPPLPGDRDADDLSDQTETDVTHTNPNDRDTDKDGLNDGNEVNNVHSNPLSKDTDGDGFSDYAEYVDIHDRLDPLRWDPKEAPVEVPAQEAPKQEPQQDPNQRPDRDNDGLFDDDETNVYSTNPDRADTDGDGRDDGQEVFDGTDPNNKFG